MARSIPSADDKIGKKIDFVAAELGQALKGHGFQRRGRRFWRESRTGDGSEGQGGGDGHDASGSPTVSFHLLDLQGDSWNAGAEGRFTLNLAVQRPALTRRFVEVSGQQFLLDGIDAPFGATCIDARLGDALPAERQPWWLPEMAAGQDIWFSIGTGTDLATLAATLARAVLEHGLPWFERHGSLAGLFAGESGAMPVYAVTASRLIAGVQLGRQAEVAALFADKGSIWFRSPALFQAVKAWLLGQGVDIAAVAFVAPAPSRQSQQQEAQVAAARAAALQAEATVRSTPAASATTPTEATPQALSGMLDAQVTIEQARFDAGNPRSPSAVTEWLLAADAGTRQQAVRLALQRLRHAPDSMPSTLINVFGNLGHVHDEAWGKMITALLADLPCDEAFARDLLQGLSALAPRFSRPGVVCIAYDFPFTALVGWLHRQALPWSEALKPEVRRLLQAITEVALAQYQSGVAATIELAAKPGADEFTRQLAASDPEPARRRVADYPEQSFEKAEREAIGLLRRWLRRDASGIEPLFIEDDDWGRQLQAARARFPGDAGLLDELLSALAHGVPSRPTPKFAKRLDGFITRLRGHGHGHEGPSREWLAALLQASPNSSLGHEWATTGPRPGVGAFVGETSGSILLGLVHLARQWDAAAFAPALARVAEAGFTLVPGVRMRSQKIAAAAVEALAEGQDNPASRALIESLRARHRKPAAKKIFDSALRR